MPLKIVRNDITKMNTEAIVNTANDHVKVGTGCDSAVYKAAGYEELHRYRAEKIGFVPEGDAFLTPGFNLQAKYIIHAVSPRYAGGSKGEEEKLRSCYRNSLQIAKENHIKSIAFPLISTGGFGYPKEEGMRIAIDEINAFLLKNEMLIYLVVFDTKATRLGEKIYQDLEAYIDQNYVESRYEEEYETAYFNYIRQSHTGLEDGLPNTEPASIFRQKEKPDASLRNECSKMESVCEYDEDSEEQLKNKLEERMEHITDTFSQYLMYLIQDKKMKNAEVWKNAFVDKKVFSKMKNDPNYHPQKRTALCLCIGAKLNLDEAKSLLARAGYALSPCDKTDIIFSYFIENQIYDIAELDIQLEEHGLPCIVS